MTNIIIPKTFDKDERAAIMQADAAFDIADGEAPSGTGPPPAPFRRRSGSPPKVPKVFVSNNCAFDCQYCGMRCGREKGFRYSNAPREVAETAVKAAKENRHGIFISSSIFRSPDYTEELIIETLKIIRNELFYRGYVHAKIMPGADPRLIEQAGFLADRISVNIELSHSDGYSSIAKQKSRQNILTPMRFIHDKIHESNAKRYKYTARRFAHSGQTTQVMAGAMGESDLQLMKLAEALYKKYDLRRVYYSPFGVPPHKPDCLPASPTPLWRQRRLYQADRLLQTYGFGAADLLSEDAPFLDFDIDPKAAWALRNIHMFPVEVQTADYERLIRVPGLGVESANKIINIRRLSALTHMDLKKMGVWMNRARFFITCGGRYEGRLFSSGIDPNHLYTGEREYTGDVLYRADILRGLLRDGGGQIKLNDTNGVYTAMTVDEC